MSTGNELLRAAAADLYGGDPGTFIERRADLAARARAAGEAAAAKQITGLRKPTRAAWIINQLVRAEPEMPAQLAELGRELRLAQRSLEGATIRELSVRRRQLIDTLVRRAFTVAGQRNPPAALRGEVAATLSAALADPEAADEVADGALERALRTEGFTAGGLPVLTLVSSSPGTSAAARAERRDSTGLAAVRQQEPRTGRDRPGQDSASRDSASQHRANQDKASQHRTNRDKASRHRADQDSAAQDRAAQDRAAQDSAAQDSASQDRAGRHQAERDRAARERAAERGQAERDRAERAAQRLAGAQDALAAADQAAGAAARAQEEQEDEVRRLEAGLAEAKQQLADARAQTRQARATQRQARQRLDRLTSQETAAGQTPAVRRTRGRSR